MNALTPRMRERESACVCVRERVCVCERERERVCVCERDEIITKTRLSFYRQFL